MLTRLELTLEYEFTEKLSYNISSLLHGIIMESIDPVYGEELHKDGMKPFHQFVSRMTENHFVWTICTLNLKARTEILDVLVTKNEFYMRHKDLTLKVVDRKLSSVTYDELISRYYFQTNPRDITIQFLTPTAFKSKGRYVFMPDVRYIFQSLILKYDASSPETKVGGDEIIEHFVNYAFIKKYNLRSVRFSLEGVWISAFLGEMTIHINGPEQMVNLAHMLAAFGEYSGIGIKGTLGMGSVIKKEEKDDRTGEKNRHRRIAP